MLKRLKVFYPVFLGIYSAVGLVSANIKQMNLSDGTRSIFVAAIFSLCVYLLFLRFIKDTHKAALLCALFMFFFFAYGHIYDAIEGLTVWGINIGRHRFILPFWLLFFTAFGWLLYKKSKNVEPFSRIANIASAILLAMSVSQIGIFEVARFQLYKTSNESEVHLSSSNSAQLPDIYYIILDGYPRQDILLRDYDFDNSDFIKQLQSLGFYVPLCSQSNYAMTQLSLASSLNMRYIEDFGEDVSNIDLNDKIINSQVRAFLENAGYQTVSLESGIWFTEIKTADYFISQKQPLSASFLDFSYISEFEGMYIRTTLLRVLEETLNSAAPELFLDPRKELYKRILFEFEQLEVMPDLPSPKFVFAHILAPHAYETVFDANGSFDYSSNDSAALADELIYINKRVIGIAELLTRGPNPSVVIIQSDHGLSADSRLANFIAIYFPDKKYESLYPSLTPVNIFRIVFNSYFGQNYPLLPDSSYYSPYEDMFNFTPVNYLCTP